LTFNRLCFKCNYAFLIFQKCAIIYQTFGYIKREIKIKKNIFILTVLTAILFVLVLFSLTIGSKFIGLSKILEIFTDSSANYQIERSIIFKLRLPRILLSVLVGMVLSLSGLVFQTLLKNPLAEPFTLGISSGASFGAALGLFISNYIANYKLPLFPFALCGGFSTIFILFYFTSKKNISLFTIIFIGVAISYFFNALLTFLMSLLGDKSYEVLLWMFGTFTNPPNTGLFLFFFVLFIVGFIFIFFHSKKMDILYMSDEVVKSIGININVTRGLLFFTVSLLTIFSVSFCGIIGFVGLIVPHLARIIFGNKHKSLIPAVCLIGGILLLVSDDIARTVVSLFNDYGKELPIGVVTSLLGTPFFLYFLLKNRKLL